ncbi:MAG: tRNA pseudouridine(38-40) synthase TruA [Tannerellaceae bacterium]|jgi:tRNA pseudouridine38-40 synthase|nr:tRNA pseudouridine(38-40) synthase TruA [Tannerellaceae bacterium]
MNRYFIYLAYNGRNYCGWQIQPNGPAVQQCLEKALTTLFRHHIAVVGAGRTDAGVHARLMVAHFDSAETIGNLPLLADRLNRLLPKDIAIDRIIPVREDAHARFDALRRTYHYYVTTRKDPFNGATTLFLRGIDFDAMNKACPELYRHTDFTSFSKLHTDVKTNNCRITYAGWEKDNDIWKFTITADRFLRNMVRAIVGTLFEVGRGKITAGGFKDIIEARDRGKAGSSAPAHALFLADITYPEDVFMI